MGFSYILNTNANVEAFKTGFNISHDVNIAYCNEGDIEDQRLPRVVFLSLMAILEVGLGFQWIPSYLGPSVFTSLASTSVCPIFIG